MIHKEIIKKYLGDKFTAELEGDTVAFAVPINEIASVCHDLYHNHNLPLKIITAADERNQGGGFRIFYVFGSPQENIFFTPYIILKNEEEFPSITNDIHEASGYERKIKSFFGLNPIGHPNPQPFILHENWPAGVFPLRKDFDWKTRPAEAKGFCEFQKIEGEGIYEIPVGPVHAGIIEPGHFRFSVAGEEIVNLEPRLGYKHKSIEKLFEVLPLEDKVRLSERVSGDTSFTHSLAFCQALENLAGVKVPERAEYLRVIFSELERLANHINDIGFIMLDTGYNFGGANCSRLKEAIMQLNERLTGSRFLRGVNTIGGVTKDIISGEKLLSELKEIYEDFKEVIEVAENSSSLYNRLSGTGKLDRQIAIDHGVVGVVGRAVGLAHDARLDFPYAAYDKLKFEMALEKDGDVRARWYVRIKEVHSSMAILEQAIASLPAGKIQTAGEKIVFPKNSLSIGAAEGWRGEIVYFVLTDEAGQISRVEASDPSFLNWGVLGYAGKGNLVPDFPLINKSFNLSYSGNDL